VASMCTASFLLAECGLLPGVTVTTHWAFAELFRRKYPTLVLDVSRILHDENRIITSGGASAALDLLLYLMRRYCSSDLARRCSRYMLIDNVRNGQSEYSMWPMPTNHNDARILQVQNWLEGEFSQHIVIDDIAQRFGFGIRNFKRRFKDATGKNRFCHTLNGSGTALPRLFAALLEANQQPDGSIRIPEKLQPYFGTAEIR